MPDDSYGAPKRRPGRRAAGRECDRAVEFVRVIGNVGEALAGRRRRRDHRVSVAMARDFGPQTRLRSCGGAARLIAGRAWARSTGSYDPVDGFGHWCAVTRADRGD